ncbi:hypothetical protein PC119_g26943 [Phytophthora cactorum]|nr:hypothetical protein PC119_g26943 [Phytophthora cactorum]KAG4032060.1 hypothetical protein PC123_g28912 [Phytophthora cactorum]
MLEQALVSLRAMVQTQALQHWGRSATAKGSMEQRELPANPEAVDLST